MVGLAGSTPAAAKAAASSAAGRSRPSAQQVVPGEVAAAGNMAGPQARARLQFVAAEARGGAGVDDLRRGGLARRGARCRTSSSEAIRAWSSRAVKWRDFGMDSPSASGRPSASHLGRPPSSTATSRTPKARKVHHTRGAENRPRRIVDHDLHAVANAEFPDGAGKGHRIGQHMRQAGAFVGDGVDVEENRAGNVARQIFGAAVALGGRQMPGGVHDRQPRRAEMVGQPLAWKRDIRLRRPAFFSPSFARQISRARVLRNTSLSGGRFFVQEADFSSQRGTGRFFSRKNAGL